MTEEMESDKVRALRATLDRARSEMAALELSADAARRESKTLGKELGRTYNELLSERTFARYGWGLFWICAGILYLTASTHPGC